MTNLPINRPAVQLDPPTNIPDLAPWIARRATVRDFQPDVDIPLEEIKEIIDAGRKAPTFGTTQMYSFVLISDQDKLSKIHKLSEGGSPQIEEASHFILVNVDIARIQALLEIRDRSFEFSPLMGLLEGTIDASLAAQALMIAAESRGYGVCPIGNILYHVDKIARLVDVPQMVLPIFGISIGVPTKDAPRENAPRVPLEAIFHHNSHERSDQQILENCYVAMNEMYGESIYGDKSFEWQDTLERYWGQNGFMDDQEPTLRATLKQQGFCVAKI